MRKTRKFPMKTLHQRNTKDLFVRSFIRSFFRLFVRLFVRASLAQAVNLYLYNLGWLSTGIVTVISVIWRVNQGLQWLCLCEYAVLSLLDCESRSLLIWFECYFNALLVYFYSCKEGSGQQLSIYMTETSTCKYTIGVSSFYTVLK